MMGEGDDPRPLAEEFGHTGQTRRPSSVSPNRFRVRVVQLRELLTVDEVRAGLHPRGHDRSPAPIRRAFPSPYATRLMPSVGARWFLLPHGARLVKTKCGNQLRPARAYAARNRR